MRYKIPNFKPIFLISFFAIGFLNVTALNIIPIFISGASAAGETYTWGGPDSNANIWIQATGGSLSTKTVDPANNPFQNTFIIPSNDPNLLNETPGINMAFNPARQTIVNGKTYYGCIASAVIILSDVNHGTVTAKPLNGSTNSPVPACTQTDLNQVNAPNNTAVTIEGAYPGNPVNAKTGSASTAASSSGSTSTAANDNACAIQDGGALSWILCPISLIAQKAIDGLSGALSTFLYTPTAQIFTQNFQGAFNNFRNLGVGLLVIAGLVMVISQAAGLELFAAYTVRKALPRIAIAAIGMVLAWPILQFVVTFFDDIGTWANQLILTAAKVNTGGAPLNSYGPGSIIGLIFVGGTALLFSAGIVMSLLGTVILALLVGFIVLAIRQLVILICILIAPLAIAAAVLPGTEKLWKFWRETLLGALVMFPIIMAFLGAGAAMSNVAGAAASGSTDNTAKITWDLLAVGSLIAPLFLLPFAFRLASGLIGAVHSLTTGRSGGAFNALSSYRKNKFGQRHQAAQTGKFWREGTVPKFAGGQFVDRLARRGSRGVQTTALLAQEPFSAGRRDALRSGVTFDAAMEAMEKNADVRSIKDNDTLIWASLEGRGTQADVRSYLERQRDAGKYSGNIDQDVGSIMRAKRSLGDGNFRAAMAVAQSGTGTGYTDSAEMLNTIAAASGGDSALAMRMLGTSRSMATQSGRHDLGSAGFGMMAGKLQAAVDGRRLNAADTADMSLNAFQNNDAVTLARGRTSSVERISTDVAEHLQTLSQNHQRVEQLNTAISNPATPATQRSQYVLERDNLNTSLADMGRLTANLENFRDTAQMYAAPERVRVISEANQLNTPVQKQIRTDSNGGSPPSIDPRTGIPNRVQPHVEGYREQRQTRSYNPNDPRNPEP